MKVVGFSFIRNALRYDYPIKEAITSILPLCDEFVVAVGNSDDQTRELISAIAPDKITIIDTTWDDNLREGGKVLAVETNKAFQAIAEDADWCFYIQGDEVVHEKYLPVIKKEMEQHLSDSKVEGLLFKYLHFYGSYDYVGDSPQWYPYEIRVIRNQKQFISWKDAQGFRDHDGRKLNVKLIDAYVYHYGWVKPPKNMQQKQENFHKLWHDDQWMKDNIAIAEEFDYSNISSLAKFQGTHPEVMKERIAQKNWNFDYDISKSNLSFRLKMKKFLNERLGIWTGFKPYKKI
ncbi:MAG: glycosyltransferase family 2 protein [Flavobacteriales bacterium]|nr:glycosyltransferase family 2 protein [Flavobacteriales bacterium]